MVSCDGITSVCFNMINLGHQWLFTPVALMEIRRRIISEDSLQLAWLFV